VLSLVALHTLCDLQVILMKLLMSFALRIECRKITLPFTWKRLYNTSLDVDTCMLYQLHNLLQRRAVSKKVKSDPTCCEDFSYWSQLVIFCML